jgi:hypothetical protein
VSGYLHPDYAASFKEFGDPRKLSRSRGWILVRKIAGSSCHDAMGCYPLFACEDWSQIAADLDEIGDDLVSLALVADPFGEYELVTLQRCFDRVIEFKEHFIVDLNYPVSTAATNHHRYYARRALRNVSVEKEPDPTRLLDIWTALYANLTEKRQIAGLRAFSKECFAKQLTVPGITAFRAVHEEEIIGIHLWYVQGEVAYSHLEAVNGTGYKVGAAYALYWSALEFFADQLRWADLGSGTGTTSGAKNGLTRFKKGWSTATRTAHFCGRIFDPVRYAELVNEKGVAATDYFPAYREGEFT